MFYKLNYGYSWKLNKPGYQLINLDAVISLKKDYTKYNHTEEEYVICTVRFVDGTEISLHETEFDKLESALQYNAFNVEFEKQLTK